MLRTEWRKKKMFLCKLYLYFVIFCFRWHHGQYFIETPGDYSINFETLRGPGIYSDIAIDDITLGVSVYVRFYVQSLLVFYLLFIKNCFPYVINN